MPDAYDVSGTPVPTNAGDPAHYFFTANGVHDANCYAYAINHTQTAHFSPGSLAPMRWCCCLATDTPVARLDAAPQVFRDACTADGLIYAGPGVPAARANHYLAALFITDRAGGGVGDYHWARQDSAGNWSHKQPHMTPTNMDFGNPRVLIMNAHTADMVVRRLAGGVVCNYQFVAYYYVPNAGLRNRSNRRCCFIATATCATLGLPDDCEELTLLRWFRDTTILRTAKGRNAVARYYEIAPQAVANIAARPDAERIFRSFHARIVAPAVAAIRSGDSARAEALFYQAMRWLPRLL